MPISEAPTQTRPAPLASFEPAYSPPPQSDNPQLNPPIPPSKLITLLCRWRIRVGAVLIAAFLIAGVINKAAPRDLLHPGWWLAVAAPLIIAGIVIRFVALGTIRKNESLADRGIYSRCRHPLYLGSLLLYIGVGIILDNRPEYWYLGIPYILIFYVAAVLNEERFLKNKFGAQFEKFKRSTPALLPFGRYLPGEFCWSRAMRKGGVKLIASMVTLVLALQAMAMILDKLS